MCNDILYKYRVITADDRTGTGNSFTRSLLTKGELYFPKFSELSDPNEAIFDYIQDTDIAVSNDELKEFQTHTYIDLLPDGRHHIKVDGRSAARHVRNRIDSMHGILCLTANNKNSLMYDYYANGHKGICVGFEWEKFGIVYRSTSTLLQPQAILYKKNPPLVNSTGGGDSFDEVFYSKWQEYSHEREYRLMYVPGIFKDKEKILASIREITFGCAISKEDKELVKTWIDSAGLSVQYFQAHLKPNSYEIELENV